MTASDDGASPPSQLSIRQAVRPEVPAIVELLADDVLGAARERPGDADLLAYFRAFDEISADSNQLLCVALLSHEIVGTMQLTFIPGLSHAGAKRGQIESVRVSGAHRGKGIGEAMIDWAVEQCQAHGCSIVQLTSDRQREAAQRFYERLGFVASHVGFKRRF